MKEELITVIIPTYKRNDTLERAIKSALNQTYKNLEIIVIDDNARFPEIRRKNESIVKKYKNITLIKNKKNLGGGLSRNVGIKNSNGELLAFLDDDDEYLPDKIEKQYKLYKKLNGKNVAIIYCYANMINATHGSYKFKKDIEGCALLENTKNCIAATSWWLCPKKPLLEVGGFEDISSRQDASLIMKLMLRGYEVYRVPEILLNYYWHDSNSGISKNNDEAIAAEKQYYNLFLEKSTHLEKKIKEEVEYYFNYRLANLYALNGHKIQAKRCLKKMIEIKKIKKENVRIALSICLNKAFIKISNKKRQKRTGDK